MTGFSQSALLQALGWATLNSFWQVGLFWCAFSVVRRWIPLSSGMQYRVAVGSLLLALVSFVASFGLYLSGYFHLSGPFAPATLSGSRWFHYSLTAASIAYLAALAIPAAKLVQNWRFLRRLRRSHLTKAPVNFRLYVQKIAWQLGIRQPVKVYLSALVQCPVTIGYLKPLVLLPVASFNQLSVQQAEAILLHELSHIRRYDFVVNIAISIIHTVLYFNPFVRMFVRLAENSRESCCDEMVLRFGYDPMAYAGALLQLEKEAMASTSLLALAATGKNTLLTRIEAIAGLPSRLPNLKLSHFSGLLASVLAILALHSLFVIGKQEDTTQPLSNFSELSNPFALVLPDALPPAQERTHKKRISAAPGVGHDSSPVVNGNAGYDPAPPPEAPEPAPDFIQVAQVDDPMKKLEAAEQAQVAQTVATTRKVLATIQWQEMEHEMADALNAQEKAEVYQQYQENLEAINWKKMEANLASQYHQTNWDELNRYLSTANARLHLDSLATVCEKAIAEVEKVSLDRSVLALPDQTETQAKRLKLQLKQVRDSLESIRHRPVIKL